MGDKPSAGRRLATCLKATPWGAFAAAALFIAGIIMWVAGTVKVLDYAMQFANDIGTSPDAAGKFKATATTAVMAITIVGLVMAAVVFLLSLFRVLQRSALKGGCCGEPEPWVFSMYRGLNFSVNVLMWLLLLTIVGILMVMLLTLGASVAIQGAITQGIATADQTLAPVGLNFNSASDVQQTFTNILNPLVDNGPLGPLLTQTSNTPFQVICPPICLNLGSFAAVLKSSSCICGADTLTHMRQVAGDATRVAGVGLGGAGAMYIAATVLLMVLSGHFVSASHDRQSARALKERYALEYENGYAADPRDCVPEPDTLPVAYGQHGAGSRRMSEVAVH